MTVNKIFVFVAALFAFVLVFPLGIEQLVGDKPYLSGIRYLLAAVIAIPTAIYAIRKYRKTASRFYVFPCFTLALGFWVASMFFMQERLPNSINHTDESSVAAKHEDGLYRKESISNSDHFYLTRNHYNDEELLFFSEKFNLKSDAVFFQN